MRRRLTIGIALALFALVSVTLAVMLVTYHVSITPTVIKSPVEFENGGDGVSTVDNINKTRATIQAKVLPLARWVSSDALRIRNVNNTILDVRLRCLSLSDPNTVIKSMKIYLVVVLPLGEFEYLAVELGANGAIIQIEGDWYPMDVDATYKVKVVTDGKDGIVEGTQATVTLGVEVRSHY